MDRKDCWVVKWERGRMMDERRFGGETEIIWVTQSRTIFPEMKKGRVEPGSTAELDSWLSRPIKKTSFQVS